MKVFFTRTCIATAVGFQALGVIHILLFEENVAQSRSAFKLLGEKGIVT